MIIEEKGLVKAIKIAYRHGGYTVLNQGGEVTIYTEGWFVRCLWTKLPRKALAIIVEHMGMIPDDGEAMAIEKDDQPQAVMAGIVSDDVAGWMGGEAASMASYAPVTFRGYQLFQEVNGRQAYGVDPTALAIVERVTAEMGTAAISGGRALAWTSFDRPSKRVALSSAQAGRIHPTQKPVALYAWIFQHYAKQGDRILDTHLGSGSSRIAAWDAGLDFIGYEIDPEYFEAQEKRFQQHTAQMSLFGGGGI